MLEKQEKRMVQEREELERETVERIARIKVINRGWKVKPVSDQKKKQNKKTKTKKNASNGGENVLIQTKLRR